MGTSLLGIELYDQSMSSLVSAIIEACTSSDARSRLISTTGAHGLVRAKKDPAFARVLQSFYRNVPDGMPAVWALRLKGARETERCYGPEFFRMVITQSSNRNIRHFFCGGKGGVAEELATVCRLEFGNPNSVGSYSPPFGEINDTELQKIAVLIDRCGSDIIWVGMSTPKQEQFAARLAQLVHAHFIITVGAAFDFHTGKIPKTPHWIQPLGLEWLFRLISEPRRLFKRYLEIVPLFSYYAVLDLLKFSWTKLKEQST